MGKVIRNFKEDGEEYVRGTGEKRREKCCN